jgi:hypothetical protein
VVEIDPRAHGYHRYSKEEGFHLFFFSSASAIQQSAKKIIASCAHIAKSQ